MMKRILFVLALVMVYLPGKAVAQLSGTYTVNGSAGASSTNYLTLRAAIADLTGGTRPDGGPAQGPGVSGAVTVNIASGTYNDQVAIGSIGGTNASRRVVIQAAAGDSTAVTYQHATGTGNNYVIQLNGCSFVTLRHLTLERTGSNTASRVIDFAGTTNDITIENCRLINRYSGNNTLSYVINDQAVTGINVNTIIRNNVISGGLRGIHTEGRATCCSTYGTGTIIEGNHISNCYDHGIWVLYHDRPIIRGNTLENTSASVNSEGIHIENSLNAAVIAQNYLTGFARYGIYVTNSNGSAGNKGVIANNYVYSGSSNTSRYGIQINSTFYTVAYNTVELHTCTSGTTNSASSALFVSAANTEVYSNILVASCGGYAICTNGATNITASDFNCLQTTGANIGFRTSARATFANWQATPNALDADSKNENPGFTTGYLFSNNNLRGAGTPVTGITTDIIGTSRPATNPDIGCHQQVIVSADAGVVNWVDPVFPRCPGLNTISVTIRNFGTAPLTSATIGWSVNGVPQTPFSWTGSLATATTSGTIHIGTYTFDDFQRYHLKFWTQNPNGNPDGNTANDTLHAPHSTIALAGTYTLGPTGDFTSFQDAVDSLAAKGICADVIIQVQSGTYTEQISIPPIPGAGTPDGPGKNSSPAENRVIFTSLTGDSTDVVLTYGASAFANNYVVQLDGADFITFRQMTIQATNGINNRVVALRNGASHIILEHNLLQTISGANGQEVIHSNHQGNTDVIIRNNRILNGSDGILFTASSSNPGQRLSISGNYVAAYQDGMHIEDVDDVVISANQIFQAPTNSGRGSAIYCERVDGPLVIASNRIRYDQASNGIIAGIQLITCVGALSGACATDNGNIYNNQVLVGGTGSSTSYGIHLNQTFNHHVFFNTFHTTGQNASSSRALYMDGTSHPSPALNSNVVLKNNIFSATVGVAIYNSVGGIIECDYNVYWVEAGTQLGRWTGSPGNVNNLAGLQGNGMDVHSLQIDPEYVSLADLTATNPALEGAGASIACITTDMDGNPRPVQPSIGPTEESAILHAGTHPLSARLLASGEVQVSWYRQSFARETSRAVLWRGASVQELAAVSPLLHTVTSQFVYTDTQLPVGTYYYQARYQDASGREYRTNLASVQVVTGGHLVVMPNPAQVREPLALRVFHPSEGDLELTLYDALGRRIYQQSRTALPAGMHQVSLPPVESTGIYTLQVKLAGQVLTQKLLVR
ncbi:MAG: right-handed parallel beta-helix repeat-containing protein [Bacteroidetes bacterium]|nr:right-handed parallel beta-helix repeat-containing protein [Bacteroidota bacterium]